MKSISSVWYAKSISFWVAWKSIFPCRPGRHFLSSARREKPHRHHARTAKSISSLHQRNRLTPCGIPVSNRASFKTARTEPPAVHRDHVAGRRPLLARHSTLTVLNPKYGYHQHQTSLCQCTYLRRDGRPRQDTNLTKTVFIDHPSSLVSSKSVRITIILSMIL